MFLAASGQEIDVQRAVLNPYNIMCWQLVPSQTHEVPEGFLSLFFANLLISGSNIITAL